jgi:hypothetical protein
VRRKPFGVRRLTGLVRRRAFTAEPWAIPIRSPPYIAPASARPWRGNGGIIPCYRTHVKHDLLRFGHKWSVATDPSKAWRAMGQRAVQATRIASCEPTMAAQKRSRGHFCRSPTCPAGSRRRKCGPTRVTRGLRLLSRDLGRQAPSYDRISVILRKQAICLDPDGQAVYNNVIASRE